MTEYEQEEPLSILAAIVCITREKNKSKALLYVFSKRADESHYVRINIPWLLCFFKVR